MQETKHMISFLITALKSEIAGSKEIAELSKKFVMVNVVVSNLYA